MGLTTVTGVRKKASGRGDAESALGNGDARRSARAAEARSRQILNAMCAFRDGEFDIRLPNDWSGLEGQIAAAFNQTIAQEARIQGEIARLGATVGKDGRLRHRMAVPGSLGG